MVDRAELEALLVPPDEEEKKKPPEEEKSAVQKINQRLGEFNTGLLNAVAGALGAPVDLVDAAMRSFAENELQIVPEDQRPKIRQEPAVGGSDTWRRFFTWLGYPPQEAEDLTGRVLEKVGEGAGTAASFMIPSGVATRLTAPARTLQPGARKAVQEVVTEPIREAPLRMAAADFAGGTVGGATGQGARELFEPVGEPYASTAEFVGNLAGGLTGATAAYVRPGQLVPKVKSAVAGAMEGVPEPDALALGRRRAAQTLQGNVADPKAVREQLLQSQREAAGITPTTAQVANEPGLAALEADFARRDPEFNRQLQVMQANNNEANHLLTELVQPQGNKLAVSQEIDRRVNHALDTLKERIKVSERKVQESLETGALSPEDASMASKDLYKAAEKEWLEQRRVLYDAVDPENKAVWSKSKLVEVAKELKKTKPKAEAAEDTPTELINLAINPPKKGGLKARESFAELQSYRSRVLQEIREEQAKPAPNYNRIRKLQKLRDAADSTLDDIGDSSAFPDVAARYKAAREYHREGAKLFREGYASKVLREGPSAIPESRILDRALGTGKGSKEAMDQLAKIAGSSEEARKLVEEYAVRSIAQEARDSNGNLVASKVKAWVDKRKTALKAFPEVLARLGDIERLQARVETLQGREKTVTTFASKGPAKDFLEKQAVDALHSAMRSIRPGERAAKVMRLVRRNPEAQEGLRRALWDDMMLKSTAMDEDILRTPFLRPRELRGYIDENMEVFKALGYSEQDIGILKRAAEQAEVTQRTKIPLPEAKLPEPHEAKILGVFGINQILSRLYGIQRGVVSGKFVAGEFTSRFFNKMLNEMTQAQMEAVLKEALINPKLAAELMEPLANMSADRVRSIAHLLTNQGILTGKQLSGMFEGDEEEER